MVSDFMKSDFQLPAHHEPLQNLLRFLKQVSTQQGLSFEHAFGSRIKTQRMGKGGMPL